MSVLIAMPAFGGNVGEKCTISLFNTAKEFTKLGIDHSLLTVANESLISRGRSRLFSFFYNSTNYEYLMFIDADIGFVPRDILKLLELNVPFASAGVPLKSLDPLYNFGVLTDSQNKPIWNSSHTAIQVDYVGTAFMLLHRNVYEKMAKEYSELKYIPGDRHSNKPAQGKELNNSYYFFQPTIGDDGNLLSEDYAFCKRWRDLGEEIWLRPDINLNHAGSHIFTGIDLKKALEENN